MKCECGCGQEVSPGKRFVTGHHAKSHMWTVEARQNISEKSRYNKAALGHNGNVTNGVATLRRKHRELRNEVCICCGRSRKIDIHHEPEVTKENAKEWSGRLVNLCRSCHKKVHYGSLTVREEYWTYWDIAATNRLFKGR